MKSIYFNTNNNKTTFKMTDAKCTLAHKKNLRDAEANKPKLLARIKAASGVDYTVDIEPKFEDFVVLLIKERSGSEDKVGDVLFGENSYLAQVALLFEKACKDDMIKEAIVEATSNKKIVISLRTGHSDSHKLVYFKDGTMVVDVVTGQFNSWMSQYSEFDISRVL